MGCITDISCACAFPQCKFKFIKWEDEEPWSVEELLKYELTKAGMLELVTEDKEEK